MNWKNEIQQSKTEPNSLDIYNFLNYWQNFISRWHTYVGGLDKTDSNFFTPDMDYSGWGKVDLSFRDYFPEPYFGNPNYLNADKIHAVFINLNPGPPRDEQSFEKSGAYLKLFTDNKCIYLDTLLKMEQDYYSSSKEKIAKKTFDWWHKFRANWINEFFKPSDLRYHIRISNILGLELSPWHSNTFSQIKSINPEFIKEHTMHWACKFSKLINNPLLRNNNNSIILSCGSGFKSFFHKEKWQEITPDFLNKKWKVWRWKYDNDTIILNFHQTATKGVVKLNFPNNINIRSELQKFVSKQ
ncbi:MAG TPA: hypothetical protein VKR58_05610, partial [Aquella sp.]|nr:hypothetical protein [Aquella sp.]